MSSRLAIDLGTARTIIADEHHGILCKQPSLVSLDRATRRSLSVGSAAAPLLGRAPLHLAVSRPLKEGRVHDFDAAALMLQAFLQQLLVKNRDVQLVVGIPLGLSTAEKLALRNLFRHLEVRSVHLVEEPLATAAAEHLDLMSECAGLVIDVGAGLTELALLGSGTILASRSLTSSGDWLLAEIAAILVRSYALRPCQRLVESIRDRLFERDREPAPWSYRGFHLREKKVMGFTVQREDFSGLIEVFCQQVGQALQDILVEAALDPHDPRLFDAGITLTGSAFPLPWLQARLEQQTALPVHIAAQPDESVIHGLCDMLSYADYF